MILDQPTTIIRRKGGKEVPVCVELRNIVKRFPGVTAVNKVSLKIKEGEIFSLLGPSGCGKTTLLRIIAGLESLDEGEVLIEGEVVNDIPPYKRDCSMVFQRLALFPHMTVAENIAFGLERRKVPKNEIRKNVQHMLQLMGLTGMEDRRPGQLSGGQQQRVALARSLVLRPKILLLDEPLASLDRKLRKEMQVELKRIQREVRTTFLYVTHDQKVALSISDRIGVMQNGKVVQIGPPDEIYTRPRTKFVADFMGASNIFLGKVITREGRKVKLQTEDGLVITAPEPQNMKSGEKITGISLHPEVIRVSPKGVLLKEENKFDGKIKEIIYQGDFSEVTISLNQTNRSVVAHLPNRAGQEINLSLNQDVVVYWDWRDSNALVGF